MFMRIPFDALRMIGETGQGRGGGFDKLALYVALMTQSRLQGGPVKRPLKTALRESGAFQESRMRKNPKAEREKVRGWLSDYVSRGLAAKGTRIVGDHITFEPTAETLAVLQSIPKKKRLPKE